MSHGSVMGDDDENKDSEATEIWVLKFYQELAGRELRQALEFVEANNLLAALDGEYRPDRAPKGNLQKTLESGLALLSKPRQQGNARGNKEEGVLMSDL